MDKIQIDLLAERIVDLWRVIYRRDTTIRELKAEIHELKRKLRRFK